MSPPFLQSETPEGQDQDDLPAGILPLMVQQAEAVASNENNQRDVSNAESRHVGRDVPRRTASDLGASGDDLGDPLSDYPPPAYGSTFGRIENKNRGFGTDCCVGNDGRVNITINETSRKLSGFLAPALRHQQILTNQEDEPPPAYVPPSLGGDDRLPAPPPMNVVIHVVGSRGDVQPFVALGKVLKNTYGHRVRLATHPVFQDFVVEHGLEFFSIGGDPAQLMAFMVKNPGLMPGLDTLRSGDVGMRRKEVGAYVKGCWRSCFEYGDGSGPEVTADTVESYSQAEVDNTRQPFVADCIIANPPSFAHVHCAEKLGIPLHIMFTMPYSPTQAFPHPLANIQSSNADENLTNYLTYALIDMLTWQGLGDVINRFRERSLGLDPVSLSSAPGMLQRLKVPHTYCWSPALIPKPKDWGPNIQVSGFYFLNLASNYTPEPALRTFLEQGPPPVYIGFGSIVLEDPNAMTELIFDAVRITSQRVLLSKGWGGMGANEIGVPDGVFMLGNVPHDWLFSQVSCVVHHGGAGTTAAGITAGKPTVVVPFFGDQPFWGAMVARAGAGPDPIPHKELTGEILADAINFCLKPRSQERAKELASKISQESGSDVGAQSFHQMLRVDDMRCTLAPERTAVWRHKRTHIRLSAFAACTLSHEGLLDFKDLKLSRAREYETDVGAWDPVTGGTQALVGTISSMMMGVADLPIETLKALKVHPDATKLKHKPELTGEASSSSSTKLFTDGQSSSPLQESETNATSGGESTKSSSKANSTFNLQESMNQLNNNTTPSFVSRGRADLLKKGDETKAGNSSSSGAVRSQYGKDVLIRQVGTAIDTGKGIKRIVGAGVKSPMDFSMGLARGFHNAPRLYGDSTVRQTEAVTDLKSGIKVASKEFGYGLFDGITGVFTQPVQGARQEGVAGFVKGMGKGFGGIMIKPVAAGFSVPAYAMKGVYKELQNNFGSSVQNYIIAARTAQGFDECSNSSEHERKAIVARWASVQKDLKKKKNPDDILKSALEEHRKKRQKWLTSSGRDPSSRDTVSPAPASAFRRTRSSPSSSDVRDSDQQAKNLDPSEFEESIQQAVQQTSRGNAEEDAAIEQAIRASMTELQRARATDQQAPLISDSESEEMRLAMAASMIETSSPAYQDPSYDKDLERALAESLREHRRQQNEGELYYQSDDADEQVYPPRQEIRVLATESSSTASAARVQDSGHLAGTTQQAYEQQTTGSGGEKTQTEKTEEEIVMAYVKKQSLLETQHRRDAEEKRAGASGS